MAKSKFVVGQEVAVDDDPLIEVDIDLQNPLPKGLHVFQLVVVDDDGLKSDPMSWEVVVRDDRKPTAVIEGPKVVNFGQAFRLSGAASADLPPGKVIRYVWTLIR